MPVAIAADSPLTPEAGALLAASHAHSAALYPPEDNFVLSAAELDRPEVLFFTARHAGAVVGIAALRLCNGYAEVKAMYVDAAARGLGVAGALLDRLVAEGRARALPVLKLETGPRNTQALALYARHGFVPCGPFGGYRESPASVFLHRPLDAPVPRRMAPDEDMAPVLALLTEAFAYMEGVIDPPSSLTRMALADLARDAARGELWAIEPGPVACMILTPEADTLYLGKLAVAASHRGCRLARVMVEQAVARARALGLPSVTLQTRVELTANHAAFAAMGFVETGRTAHPGFARPTSITYHRTV
jgi:ribosomal protein S18 acetylase RimI-like enzyme